MPKKSSGLPSDLWAVLNSRLTEERKRKMERTAELRTDRVRLVLQDIHHPHNISACMRSAEAFGIQNVHVVNRTEKFRASSAAKGVERWLSLNKHESIAECVKELRKSSFKIAAAMPNPEKCVSLYELDLSKPIAVVFANEHEGMAEEFKEHVDYFFTIPMVGMVESLNISVCAAITMNYLRRKVEERGEFLLSEKQRTEVLNKWIADQFESWATLYERLKIS